MNYTNKTQFLFRIEKNCLDINDPNVNSFLEPHEYRISFRNMIYIGDSDTDIPCMKLVNMNGGHSIGVYNPVTQDKSKVHKMLNEHRIKYYVSGDYSEDKPLELLVKDIIHRTAANEILEQKYLDCLNETNTILENQSKEEQQKIDLIDKLEASNSFRTTHQLIEQLTSIHSWSLPEKEKLVNIALSNNQIRYILTDDDVYRFYSSICNNMSSKAANEIKEILSQKIIE